MTTYSTTNRNRLTSGEPESRPGNASILDDLLTAEQIARLLQLRVSTVEDYARRGILPSLKVGRHRRFLRSQVEQTLAGLGQ